MSADPSQTTPPPRSTYSLRMTPAHRARLAKPLATTHYALPVNLKAPKPTQLASTYPAIELLSCAPLSLLSHFHCPLLYRRTSNPSTFFPSPYSVDVTQTATRALLLPHAPAHHTIRTPPPPAIETTRASPVTVTPHASPTSISAIPRITSQLLSALAGPLITPRNLTTDILRTLLGNTPSPQPTRSLFLSPYSLLIPSRLPSLLRSTFSLSHSCIHLAHPHIPLRQ